MADRENVTSDSLVTFLLLTVVAVSQQLAVSTSSVLNNPQEYSSFVQIGVQRGALQGNILWLGIVVIAYISVPFILRRTRGAVRRDASLPKPATPRVAAPKATANGTGSTASPLRKHGNLAEGELPPIVVQAPTQPSISAKRRESLTEGRLRAGKIALSPSR